MKPFAFVLTLWACLALISTACAQPITESMRGEIKIPLAQPSTEDYLLALGRVGNANFLIDAASLPEATAPFTGEWKERTTSASGGQWKGRLGSILFELAYDRDLTWAAVGERTFVVWPDQPFQKLGKRIAAGEGIKMAGEVLPDDKFIALLQDYLKREHGWDSKSSDLKLDIKFDDLPPSIRPFVVAKAQEYRLTYVSQPFVDQKVWFSDDFWKEAIIHARKMPKFLYHSVPMLFVGSPLPAQEAGTTNRRVVFRRIASMKNYTGAAEFEANGLWLNIADSGGILFQNFDKLPPEARRPPTSTAAASAVNLQVLQPAELETEKALAVPVSLDARRRPVKDLLSDVQKQSGVSLTMSAGLIPEKALVTAHLKEMPLSSFMAALSRLYSVRWSKTESGYAMNPSDRSEVEQKITEMGDWFRFLSWQSLIDAAHFSKHLTRKPLAPWADGEFEQGPENAPLAEEIWPYVSGGDLRKGVPFSTLPEELQQKVRAFIEDEVGDELTRNFTNGTLESLKGYRLYIAARNPNFIDTSPPKPETPTMPGVFPANNSPRLKAFFRETRGGALGEFPLVPKEEDLPIDKVVP